MNNQHFVVLFHQVNYPLAARMTRHLTKAGFTFALVCEDDLRPEETLAGKVENDSRPLLIMVSDNFLKTESCVSGLLQVLQLRTPAEVQIIVLTEGISEEGREPVPTRLDRVGQILHYINFWQDRYLQLRKVRPDQSRDDSQYESRVKQVRQIAFEIGNLIEFLKEQPTYHWDALTANHYELFFRKSGNLSLHESFREDHPYLEEDEELEERIRDAMSIFQEEQDRLVEQIEPLMEESVPAAPATRSHGEENGTSGNQEQDLLKKLIAYKNGVESPDMEDDDDWDEDDDEDSTGSDRSGMEERATEPDTIPSGGTIISLHQPEVAHWIRLLEKDPENITARLELASFLSRDDKHFNETTAHLEEVLRQDPRNAQAFTLLGDLSARYKEFKLAQRYYEKALEHDPASGAAHLGLGRLLNLQKSDPERALDHLAEARALLPDNPDVWELYGNCLVEAGKTKKALKAFKKVMKLDPGREEDLQSRMSELYYQIGDRIKAVQVHRSGKAEPGAGEIEVLTPEVAPSPTRSEGLVGSETDPKGPPVRKPAAQTLTILITGATSGIGLATARKLAAEGHRLILTGRREDRLNDLRRELTSEHQAETYALSFDIRQEAVTRQMVKALPEGWANVDVLINNAGLASGLAPIHEGDVADWDLMIDTNIKGLLYMTRAITPGMVARKRGQIINICSTAGKETYPNGNVYCATKFAVEALTRSMRQDLHPYGIRVGQVSPGHVEETEFALVRFHGDREKARIYEDFNPLRATDVAETIAFMIRQPAHVNIQDILLMGTQQGSATMVNRTGRVYDPD